MLVVTEAAVRLVVDLMHWVCAASGKPSSCSRVLLLDYNVAVLALCVLILPHVPDRALCVVHASSSAALCGAVWLKRQQQMPRCHFWYCVSDCQLPASSCGVGTCLGSLMLYDTLHSPSCSAHCVLTAGG